MRRPSLLALATLALAAAACDRQAPPTSPRAGKPALGIFDGSNTGNRNFFFLPPVVPNPVNDPNYVATGFNARLHPRVEVCRLSQDAVPICDLTVATFPAGSAVLDATGQMYSVQWHTDQANPALDPTRYYRIRVLLGTTEIGYADVDPVSNGSQLKNVQTGQYIGLVDGRTLPINFRIQNGVLCPDCTDFVEQSVTNDGGTVVTNTGFAGASFPQGWLPDGYTDVVVTITREVVPPDNHCVDGNLIQFEGCYHYSTDPVIPHSVAFAKAITVGQCTEIDETDPRYHYLLLFASDVDEPVHPLYTAPAPFLTNCDAFTGTPAPATSMLDRAGRGMRAFARALGGMLSPRPAYAVHLGLGGLATDLSDIGWATAADASVKAGDGQTGVAGATLPVNPTVLVMSRSHGDPSQPPLTNDTPVPLAGIPVTFAIASGGGSLGTSANPDVAPPTTITVNTDANGLASVPWTLGGATAVAQTVTAAAPVMGSPLTFSAHLATAFGSIIDPTGDNVVDSRSGTNQPDIIGASMATDGQSTTFTIDVTRQTDVANTLLQFQLDTDVNAASGSPGVDAAGNDATLMGTDALIDISQGSAQPLRYAGTPNSFVSDGSPVAVQVTQVPTGYRLTVVFPRVFSSNAAGQRFKVTAAAALSGGFTGVLDYAPDLGAAPGTLTSVTVGTIQ